MAGKTILAVDDDPSTLLYLGQVLKREGYRVLTAASGEEAQRTLESEMPDLMLLDIQMPGVGGHEFLERIRREERTAHLPVIFLTVKDTRDDEARGLKQGVVDYMSKDILTPELVQILCHRLRNFFVWQENERLRGVLATIVSANHEVNNPLTVILGSAEVIRMRGFVGAEPEGAQAVERIIAACTQIKAVLEKITHMASWEVKRYLEGVEMLDLGRDEDTD